MGQRRLNSLFMFLGLLVGVPDAWAAIAHDLTSSAQCDSCASVTVSHTVTGSNLMLIGCSGMEHLGHGSDSVSGATWNGVAMSAVDQTIFSGGHDVVSQWYLINPDTGTHDLVFSFSTPDIEEGAAGIGTSLTGVSQAAPEAQNKANGTGTAITVSVITVAANAWLIDCVEGVGGAVVLTVNAAQTQLANVPNTGNMTSAVSSQGPIATPGSTAMAWTAASSEDWATIASSYAPATTVRRIWSTN